MLTKLMDAFQKIQEAEGFELLKSRSDHDCQYGQKLVIQQNG